MYRKVLVALDGSSLAESVLGDAKTLATGCGATELVLPATILIN
jgi:nucleotide-binding universal stress UspA family protein